MMEYSNNSVDIVRLLIPTLEIDTIHHSLIYYLKDEWEVDIDPTIVQFFLDNTPYHAITYQINRIQQGQCCH